MELLKKGTFPVCETMTKELGFEVGKRSAFCSCECPYNNRKESKHLKNGDYVLSCGKHTPKTIAEEEFIFILFNILQGAKL